jgi:hypothetical protein
LNPIPRGKVAVFAISASVAGVEFDPLSPTRRLIGWLGRRREITPRETTFPTGVFRKKKLIEFRCAQTPTGRNFGPANFGRDGFFYSEFEPNVGSETPKPAPFNWDGHYGED